jgi:hypothetical protein
MSENMKLWGALIVTSIMAGLPACSKSSGGNSREFTAEEYGAALRSVALRTTLGLPDSADLDAILNSSSPKTTYEGLVDEYVASEDLRGSLQDYFVTVFGMGGDEDDADLDDPARFATYIVMQDLPWSELITADYKIDSGFIVQKGQGSNAPLDKLAGFMTFPSWLETYAGNGFLFNYVREVARVTECYKYPDPDETTFSWDEDNIGTKYLPQSDINCFECHRTMNVRRSAWYKWNTSGTSYNEDRDPSDVFGHDDGVLEPRAGASFKFTTGQITSPKTYADQIVAHPRFTRCACRRFMAWALGYQGDLAGPSGRLMFDFDASSQQSDIDLLNTCTDKLGSDFGLRIRTMLKWFFKSNEFVGRIAGLSE